MIELDEDKLRRCFPACPATKVSLYTHLINSMLVRADAASTRGRAGCLLGQIGHESGDLHYMREIWDPGKVPEQALYERDPDAPWPYTKENQRNRKAWNLGNSEVGDGFNFRGYGPIQTTGRANTLAFSLWRYGDKRLADHPELLVDPAIGFDAAAWFWVTGARQRLNIAATSYLAGAGYDLRTLSLNECADRGDWQGITLAVNGGLKTYDDRAMRTDRIIRLLGEV